ncbi:hypothetical protein Pcinc_032248 [Petrolisthes cinctipes]|uniref:Uncharacterized protein n=1 Tax=Petrolisthes cinctipes TaxID=88211 RepID=A0AAE1EUY2_PETCI|nr:hypothetical protein Pcinc_032248 [Petrolisthes cinctipes]
MEDKCQGYDGMWYPRLERISISVMLLDGTGLMMTGQVAENNNGQILVVPIYEVKVEEIKTLKDRGMVETEDTEREHRGWDIQDCGKVSSAAWQHVWKRKEAKDMGGRWPGKRRQEH